MLKEMLPFAYMVPSGQLRLYNVDFYGMDREDGKFGSQLTKTKAEMTPSTKFLDSTQCTYYSRMVHTTSMIGSSGH